MSGKIKSALIIYCVVIFLSVSYACGSDSSDKHKNPGTLAEYDASIDTSCNTDNDCTIKDVHNCCGYFPRCINVDAQTNPELVKELCKLSGLSSICGFPEIKECYCSAGICKSRS